MTDLSERIRAAISDSYYDARNDGLTMGHAADQATAKVVVILEEREQQWRDSTAALVREHAEEMRDAGRELRDMQAEINGLERQAEQWT